MLGGAAKLNSHAAYLHIATVSTHQQEAHVEHDQVLDSGEVVLRPLSEDDIPLLARWLFDPEVVHWLQLSEDPPHLRTLQAVRERFERMHAEPFSKIWRIEGW